MPTDIRNFFGRGPRSRQDTNSSYAESKTQPAIDSHSTTDPTSRVIDCPDDGECLQIATRNHPLPPKRAPNQTKTEPRPVREETTTSAFFASAKKPQRSENFQKTSAEKCQVTTSLELASKQIVHGALGHANDKAIPHSRNCATARTNANVMSNTSLDGKFKGTDVLLKHEIIGKGNNDFCEGLSSDDDLLVPLPHRSTTRAPPLQKVSEMDSDEAVSSNEIKMKDEYQKGGLHASVCDPLESQHRQQKQPTRTGRKRKSREQDDHLENDTLEDGDEENHKQGRAKKATSAKSPRIKKAKKEEFAENPEIQAIYDGIPTVRAPTPPPRNENAKFDWRAKAVQSEPTSHLDSSSNMPSGSETCLAGLNFVFTGVLQRWGRTEAQELVKRHGGKVTGAPSKKTSFVVLGADAGPAKLQKIKEMNIKTIDEDGLTLLIEKLSEAGKKCVSKAQVAYKEQQRKDEEKIRQQAAELEIEEKARLEEIRATSVASRRNSKAVSNDTRSVTEPGLDSRLWTTKYAPTSLGQICGNKAVVEKLHRWLQMFPRNLKTNFRLAGKDGSGVFRAVMLHGPPGIGKTTAAHLIAKLEGYDVVERNASDTRSKKLIEDGLRGVLSTNSLYGYFASDGKKVDVSRKKLVLIMDEVDGMSAGDRGGVGALATVCKKTEIPMILICNDRRVPKMKPFDFVTYDLPFRRPTVEQVRSRIMTIAYREELKMPPAVINALIEGSHADIRQVINMISTAKLDQEVMDFSRGQQMSKNWEKHVILKPWEITQRILGGALFSSSSKATLNEKIELYFNDHEFSPLMLQENYLGTNPIQCLGLPGKERNFKHLELASQAADSISDGDLADRMIHSSQQQWSLMPTHAVFSFVRPASFVAGSTAGHQTRFTSWLGKNSSANKLGRMIKEIQAHMRLRCSGDRHEVRQQYVPILWMELVQKLQKHGKQSVPQVIELMDSYFLTKDDFDAIIELGVGSMNQESVKIDSQAKATFTRLYNQQTHPLPFIRASTATAPKKQVKEKPDLEEAIEESDEGEVVENGPEDDEDVDLSKDKYVKQPRKKAPPRKAATATKGGKREALTGSESDQEGHTKRKGKNLTQSVSKYRRK